MACLLPIMVWAEDTSSAIEIDSSCQPIAVDFNTIAEEKNSRLDNHFFVGHEGKKIRHIDYKTMPIFDESDPQENNRLYRLVNRLHMNTRSKVVRTQLLFREGDLLEINNIFESERILRSRNYLTNAYIIPTVICSDAVDLMVVTQDSWSLEPQFSLRKESEGTKSGFAIADGNIFGSGNSFTVGYEENSQRNLVHYEFKNPHVFNSQIATKLYYADTSDGKNTIVDISHPFYSLETLWGAGIYAEDYTQDDLIRFQDKQINSFVHQSVRDEIFYGLATEINSEFTRRWVFGFSQEDDIFLENDETLQIIPENRKASYPWVELQYLENRYGVFKNINQIQRLEDIALGSNFVFRVGYAGKNFDNLNRLLRYKGLYQYTLDIRDKHIFETSVTLDGRHYDQDDAASSRVFGLAGAYHYFHDDKNRWYLGLQYHAGQNLSQYEELTLGDINGMRGYPTDFQRGKKRYLITLERRYFSDIHIFNLSRLGVVAFYDHGKAWGIDHYDFSNQLSNIGLGLRFSPTKVRVGNVVHINIAMPISSKSGADDYQITVGAYQKF